MSRHRIFWTAPARRDLEAVIRFIAETDPLRALKTARNIRERVAALKNHPRRGRRLPELAHLPAMPFRELILSPWRIPYRVHEGRVEILGFLDSRRDLEDLLYERLMGF